MSAERRLRTLAFALAGLGVISAVLARVELTNPPGLERALPPFGIRHVLIVPLFAVTAALGVLVALWGVYSASSPWRRLAGLALGAACFEAMLGVGFTGEFLGVAAVTVALVTAGLLAVRALGGVLAGAAKDGEGVPQPEGLKFSIRGLMAFTAAVGLLSAGARALESHPSRQLFLSAVWGLCFVASGLACLWAALGESRPSRRAPAVFALAPALAACFAHAARAHSAGHMMIHATMLLYPSVLLGALLVVRSSGYRLVRRPAAPAGKTRRSDLSGSRHGMNG